MMKMMVKKKMKKLVLVMMMITTQTTKTTTKMRMAGECMFGVAPRTRMEEKKIDGRMEIERRNDDVDQHTQTKKRAERRRKKKRDSKKMTT